MDSCLKEQFVSICGEENVLFDEPLKKHTSFRIGGPAEVFVTPADEEQLEKVLNLCDENGVRRFILGNGTNVLAADEGYEGAVIQIYKLFNDIEVEGEVIKAGAGALLASVSSAAYKNGLTGFEFASGIPGTLGGAVTMNAGAYGGEMKDVLVSVRAYVPGKGIVEYPVDQLSLGYRTSIVKHQDMIVLSAVIKLENGDKETIKARLDELREARTSKQPLDFPSAGSTFKRPEGYFAGKLIMDAGLKGFTVGGASVSEKHAGFVINVGNATCKDVTDLMEQVSDIVREKYGVSLEPEVLFLK